ncbi:phage tail tape measure protein [Cryobacterium sp. HLT2-28]|nr:phage tail tape measure protein [Cryobacterium sp. HLT2-28]
MADRIVKVALVAQVTNYLSGMEQARKATQGVGTEAEKARAKLEAQSQAMTSIGTGMVGMGALALVGVGLAVKKFSDFDAAISNVKAATQETTGNMALLRDAALKAGASTVYSATEAAGAIEELGKAGLSTKDILSGGLDAALSLAAAGVSTLLMLRVSLLRR